MKHLYTALLFIAVIPLCAQNSLPQITGILKEQNGEAAAFVAVILLNKDSAVVKTEVSNAEGRFNFLQVKSGEYRIVTRSLQYKPFKSDFFNYTVGQSSDLGKVELATSVTELKEVTVTGARQMVEIHPDKTVFNVQGTINSSGNDAIDLLSKAPGIILDNNENLVVMGKNGVLIYIDGKRVQLRGDDLTAMLKSLRSENIEAVEIITNPSAKYDAEGNAGIINIRLKRDANLGLNGTVVVGYSIDLHNRYNAGLTFNNRSKKSNLFGAVSLYDNKGESHFHLDRRQNGYLVENRSVDVWNNKGADFRLGTDFFLNKKHTLGVLANSTLIDRSNETNARTPIRNDADYSIDQLLIAENHQRFDITNTSFNVNYQYKGEKGTSLNVDGDLGHYTNYGDTFQPNTYFDDETQQNMDSSNANRNDRRTIIDIKTLKADYERNLLKGQLGFGFKLSSVESENSLLFLEQNGSEFETDSSQSNTFNYTEEIMAFYLNYNVKAGQKFNLNAGLRSETTRSLGVLTSSTNVENNRVKRNYTGLFPTAGITMEIDKKNKVGISYSRRIDRPNYQNLNPFRFKLDELNFAEGNPFLKPQYTSNYQVTYSWNSKFNLIASYSITNDFFARVLDTTNTENIRASKLIPKNMADGYNTALNASYPFDITDWWNLRGNVNIYYARYKAFLDGVNFDLDVAAYNISFQSTVTMPHDFKAEVSMWYNSPSIWQGTIKTNAMWSLTMGLRKSVFKNGQLTASLNDVFNTQRWYIHSNYGGQKVDGSGRFSFRRFIVGFNYRFGNQKVKASRNRKGGIEEERSRLSEGQ
ncbi:MAG: TonB-dependent receptor [Flammeovirgaceae bacterium]|nr:TonB-dependent receptor [Flammeovirgaceae bacterium]